MADPERSGPVGLQLVAVGETDKSVLANLLQLYCCEFSAIRGYAISPHGTYPYKYLDHYFLGTGDREAYFLTVDTELAGFALCRLLPDKCWEIAEFFILPKFRRKGMGASAASLVLTLHPGTWRIAFDDANVTAASFWEAVAGHIFARVFSRSSLGPPEERYPKTVLVGGTRS